MKTVSKKGVTAIVSLTMQLSTGLFIIFHKANNEPQNHGKLRTIYATYPYQNEAAGLRHIAISIIGHITPGLA